MSMLTENAKLLVVSCDAARGFSIGDAYAHPTAFGARKRRTSYSVTTWGDINTSPYDDGDKLPMRGFELTSQVDGKIEFRDNWPYAIRYGYKPEGDNVMTSRDVAVYGKPLAAIERAMAKAETDDGPAATFGQMILRLARALRVEAIVLMRPRPWGDDTETHLVFKMADKPGEAVWHIDEMVRKARRECQKRSGTLPVSEEV